MDQLVDALSERCDVVEQNVFTTGSLSAGAVLNQSGIGGLVGSMQATIEHLCGENPFSVSASDVWCRFADPNGPVKTTNAGTPSGDLETWVRDNAYVNLTWTLLKTRAGLNASGWKRVDSTGATAYGRPQVGDVFGSWIVNELKAAIDVLTHVKVWRHEVPGGSEPYHALWVDTIDDDPNDDFRHYYSSGTDAGDYGIARGAAAAAWSDPPPWLEAGLAHTIDNKWWEKYTASYKTVAQYTSLSYINRYKVRLFRADDLTGDVSIYAFPWAFPGYTDADITAIEEITWDDCGEGLTENVPILVEAFAASADQEIDGSNYEFDDDTTIPPDVVTEPIGNNDGYFIGFRAVPMTVIDFGVSGGFVYY